MSDTLNFVAQLEREFLTFKADTSQLEMVNNELNSEFRNFTMMHMKNIVV